jgi:hypothetical protein
MTDTVQKQILDIRKSGVMNMFDIPRVQREAYDIGYNELVLYIEEHKIDYIRFILTGEIESTS